MEDVAAAWGHDVPFVCCLSCHLIVVARRSYRVSFILIFKVRSTEFAVSKACSDNLVCDIVVAANTFNVP